MRSLGWGWIGGKGFKWLGLEIFSRVVTGIGGRDDILEFFGSYIPFSKDGAMTGEKIGEIFAGFGFGVVDHGSEIIAARDCPLIQIAGATALRGLARPTRSTYVIVRKRTIN